MCDEKEKIEKISIILREIQKLNGNDADSLLKALEHVRKILNSLIGDWEVIVGQMVGLWENYMDNPKIPEEKKRRVNALIHQSVTVLRKLSENGRYLQASCTLTEQLITKLKELKS